MLVPEPFLNGLKPEILLAAEDHGPAILGAMAYRHGERFTTLWQIRVIAPMRRRGIGTLLLRKLLWLAQQRSRDVVWAFANTGRDAAAEPFLRATGFTLAGRLLTVHVELEQMLAGLAGIRDRLLRSGRMPAAARLVPLAEAPTEAAACLYETCMLTQQPANAGYVEASLADQRLHKLSVVAMDGDRVAGILLADHEGDLARVVARVVAPEYRGGWVNVMMMTSALESGRSAGIRWVQFESQSANSDTVKLSRRFGGVVMKTIDSLQRLISPGESYE